MDKVYIYGLYTSIDDRIRYVGKSVNPDNRLRDHLKEAKEKHSKYNHSHYPKNKWILKNIKLGVEIKYKILEICDINSWEEKEKKWIKYYRDNSNYEMLNIDDGGYGMKSKNFLSYEECREWVTKNYSGKKTQTEWKKYVKEKGVPEYIPHNPSVTYYNSDRGFSWIDFFSKNVVNTYKIKKYSFGEIKQLCRKHNFSSISSIIQYRNETNDYRIPKDVLRYYERKGFDVNTILVDKFVPYEIFKRYIKLYFKNIYGIGQFRKEHHKMNKRIPYCIEKIYKNEYDNFEFMLDNGKFIYTTKKFYSFEEWKKKVKEYDFLNSKDYKERYKIDEFLPKSPETTYCDKWVSWSNYINHNVNRRYTITFNVFKRYMSIYHRDIKKSTQYKKMMKNCNISKKIPVRPDSYFGVRWNVIFS